MDNQQIITFDSSGQSEYNFTGLNSTELSQFRLSPFRVLRLPVVATSAEVWWQAEKVLSLVRLNLPPQESDPIPWLPGNDEMEIKQAAQKLEEPLQRVVEQLF